MCCTTVVFLHRPPVIFLYTRSEEFKLLYTVDANNAGSNEHKFEKINAERLKSNHGRLQNFA